MDAREIKAMQIAATMPLRRTTYGWIVPSQSGTGRATRWLPPTPRSRLGRSLDGLHLHLPRLRAAQQPCKHIIAVEMTVRRETAPTAKW